MGRKKGWFKRIFTGLVRQYGREGRVAQVDRIMDRDNDRYAETVVMRDSGEVVYHCDEPLSEHRGHGSDRPERPK
jgi:hypothetical protein